MTRRVRASINHRAGDAAAVGATLEGGRRWFPVDDGPATVDQAGPRPVPEAGDVQLRQRQLAPEVEHRQHADVVEHDELWPSRAQREQLGRKQYSKMPFFAASTKTMSASASTSALAAKTSGSARSPRRCSSRDPKSSWRRMLNGIEYHGMTSNVVTCSTALDASSDSAEAPVNVPISTTLTRIADAPLLGQRDEHPVVLAGPGQGLDPLRPPGWLSGRRNSGRHHEQRYDLNLWIGHSFEGAAYLPR